MKMDYTHIAVGSENGLPPMVIDEKAFDKLDNDGNLMCLFRLGTELKNEIEALHEDRTVNVKMVQPTRLLAKPEILITVYDNTQEPFEALENFEIKEKAFAYIKNNWWKENGFADNPISAIVNAPNWNKSTADEVPFTIQSEQSKDSEETAERFIQLVIDTHKEYKPYLAEQEHQNQISHDMNGVAFEELNGIVSYGEPVCGLNEIQSMIDNVQKGITVAKLISTQRECHRETDKGDYNKTFESDKSGWALGLIYLGRDNDVHTTMNHNDMPIMTVLQGVNDFGGKNEPSLKRDYVAQTEIWNDMESSDNDKPTKVFFYDRSVMVNGQRIETNEDKPFIAIDENGKDRTAEMLERISLAKEFSKMDEKFQNDTLGKEVSERLKAEQKPVKQAGINR